MLKKYGKAIEQPQGPLPLLLHSEQMDGPTEPRGAGRTLVQDGPSHLLPGTGCLASTQSLSFQRNPSSPTPSGECGLWKGKATPESDGNRRGSDRLEALSSRVLSAAWPQDGRRGCPLRSWSPIHICFMRPQLAGSPPLILSWHQGWPQPWRRPWSETERQRQLAASHKEGCGQWDFRNKFNFGFPTYSNHKS